MLTRSNLLLSLAAALVLIAAPVVHAGVVVTDGRNTKPVACPGADDDDDDDGDAGTDTDTGRDDADDGEKLTPTEQKLYLLFAMLSSSHYVSVDDDPNDDSGQPTPYGGTGPYSGSYIVENIDGEVTGGCSAAQPGAAGALMLLALLGWRRRSSAS